ncbi:MAG: hypothetical protein ACXABY_06170 [Candidatus Thorarchaeota archaeon]|jgi:hypothetical protein
MPSIINVKFRAVDGIEQSKPAIKGAGDSFIISMHPGDIGKVPDLLHRLLRNCSDEIEVAEVHEAEPEEEKGVVTEGKQRKQPKTRRRTMF